MGSLGVDGKVILKWNLQDIISRGDENKLTSFGSPQWRSINELSPWSGIVSVKLSGPQASQETICVLPTPKMRYRVHKRRPPALTLTQISPFNATHPISRRSTLMLSTHIHLVFQLVSFPSSLTTITPYAPLVTPVRATCLAHLILVYLITRIIRVEKCR
jgi:hypothetical protein